MEGTEEGMEEGLERMDLEQVALKVINNTRENNSTQCYTHKLLPKDRCPHHKHNAILLPY